MDSSQPEVLERKRPIVHLAGDEPGDEIPRDDKEDIDSNIASRAAKTEVEQDDENNSQGSQAINFGSVVRMVCVGTHGSVACGLKSRRCHPSCFVGQDWVSDHDGSTMAEARPVGSCPRAKRWDRQSRGMLLC